MSFLLGYVLGFLVATAAFWPVIRSLRTDYERVAEDERRYFRAWLDGLWNRRD